MTQWISDLKKSVLSLVRKGALHILIGNFFTKFVTFFGSIVVVRLLTKEEYGVLTYIENIYGYAYIITGFGLSYALLRYIVLAEDRREQKNIFVYVIKRAWKIDLFILLIVSIIILIYSHPKQYEQYKLLLIISMFALPFNDLLDESLNTERALLNNKKFAFFSISVSFFMIVGKIVGVYTFNISGIVISKIIIYFTFSMILLIIILKKDLSIRTAGDLGRDKTIKKKEIKIYSFQYMVTNGFWAFYMLNDTFLLGLLGSGVKELADYKVAYVLPGNISIISAAIGMFVAPYFVINAKRIDWIRKNFVKCYIFTATLVGAFVGGIYLFSEFLILFLYGKQYLSVIPIMKLLLIAAFINCGLRYTTANILAAMGDIKYNMVVSFAGIIAQILLNWKLIPRFGIYGVAYTSIACYSIMASILFIVFYYKYMRLHNMK